MYNAVIEVIDNEHILLIICFLYNKINRYTQYSLTEYKELILISNYDNSVLKSFIQRKYIQDLNHNIEDKNIFIQVIGFKNRRAHFAV